MGKRKSSSSVTEKVTEENNVIEPVVEDAIVEETVIEETAAVEEVVEIVEAPIVHGEVAFEEPIADEVSTQAEPIVTEITEEVAIAEVTDTTPINEFKVGDYVGINPSAKTTVTGRVIPSFAYKNVYKITKILSDRVVIVCKSLTFGMNMSDLLPTIK